jgi:putative membrane protein
VSAAIKVRFRTATHRNERNPMLVTPTSITLREELPMLRTVTVLLVAMAAAAPAAFAADPPSTAAASPTMPVSTDQFLMQAAAGNQFEIDSSKLAISKTKSEQVKAFANQMVTDHGQAAGKMKQAVTDAKAKAPADKLDAKHQAIVDDLKKRDSTAFDKAYVDAQMQAHVETVALFESYAKRGDNARIKAFATEMLPTLRTHLDHVKKLKSSMGTT